MLATVWLTRLRGLSCRDLVQRPVLEIHPLTHMSGRDKSSLPAAIPAFQQPALARQTTRICARNALPPITAIKFVLANPSHPLIFCVSPLGAHKSAALLCYEPSAPLGRLHILQNPLWVPAGPWLPPSLCSHATHGTAAAPAVGQRHGAAPRTGTLLALQSGMGATGAREEENQPWPPSPASPSPSPAPPTSPCSP